MSTRIVRILAILAALHAGETMAAACVSQATGAWNAPATWTACGGGFPVAADTVTIQGGFNVTVNIGTAAATSVQLGGTTAGSGNGTLTFNPAATALTVSGTVTLGNGARTGILNMAAGGTLTLQGFVSTTPGAFTPGTGTIVLTGNNTLPASANYATYNNLTVNGAGTTTALGRATVLNGNLDVTAGSLTVNNALDVIGTTAVTGALNITVAAGAKRFRGNTTISGTWNNSANGNVRMDGNLTDNGTFTSGTGTYNFQGAAAQSITGTNGGTTSFANLTLNNVNNLSLTGTHDVTVTTLLTLTTGVLITNANTVYISNGSAIASAGANDFVIGNLKKAFTAGANVARVFEVGTGASFSPVTVTFASVTVAGDLTVSSSAGSHPQLATSGLDTAAKLNRWWTFTNSATSPISFTTYGAVFTFVAGDVDVGAAPTAFIAARFASGAWNPTTAGAIATATTNTITAETGFGDFAFGEGVAQNPIAGSGGRFNAYDTTTPLNSVNGYIGTKLAGTAFSLVLVHLNAGGTALANLNAAVTVELLDGTNSTGVFANNCWSNWTNIQTLAPNPNFPNVNQITVSITENSAWKDVRVRVTSGAQIGCSGDHFAIRPAAFAISSSANNNGSGAGTVVKAGANFTLTASATGYSGTPLINTAQVIGSPTAGTLAGAFAAAVAGAATGTFTYSEVGNIGLNADAVTDPSFTAVDQPGGCVMNSTSNILASNRYGCSIGQAAIPQTTGSSGFGRFTPDHYFVAAGSTLTNRTAAACAPASTFTYMNEGIGFSFTLQARNSGAIVTQNYAGAYVKLTPATIANLGFGAVSGATNFGAAPSRLDLTLGSAGAFAAGQAAVTATVGIRRLTALDNPDGPFTATKIGIAPLDTDAVTARAVDMNMDVDSAGGNDHVQIGANTEIRFGRLRLQNAIGSEKLGLLIPIETQYWAGTGFATNTLDSCTTLARANFALSSYTGNLNACETVVFGTVGSPTTVSFANGVGTMSLTAPCTGAPCAGNDGSVLITPNLAAIASGNQCAVVGGAGPAATSASMPYLLGRWNDTATTEAPDVATTNYDDNPSSRAVFGIYGSQPGNFIYFRENF